jgi:hypothetical protein
MRRHWCKHRYLAGRSAEVTITDRKSWESRRRFVQFLEFAIHYTQYGNISVAHYLQ